MESMAYMRGWVTGFFDGEGCVLFNRRRGKSGNGNHFQYYLNASNTDEVLVQTANKYLTRLGIPSKIEGPYASRSLGTKPVWRVHVYGAANIVKFDEVIGFRCIAKAEKLALLVAYIKRDGPRMGPVTWKKATTGQLGL